MTDMSHQNSGSFYDELWNKYVPEYSLSEKHWETFFTANDIEGKYVLDAGCGTGIFSLIFAKKGAKKVEGIDISEGILEKARSLRKKFKIQNIGFKKEDMLDLSFKDKTFDIVWAWGSIHHTTAPLKALEELIRVLKRDGSLLLAVYNRTKITFLHEILRKILVRMPRKSWAILTKILASVFAPVVFLFKKREKSRKGEKLEELILDWYFVPIKHYYLPKEIIFFLEERGFRIEKFLPYSGRFNSTSNFILKASRLI